MGTDDFVLKDFVSKKYKLPITSELNLRINHYEPLSLFEEVDYDLINYLGNSLLPLFNVYALEILTKSIKIEFDDFEDLFLSILKYHKNNYISLNYRLEVAHIPINILICNLEEFDENVSRIKLSDRLTVLEPSYNNFELYDAINGFNLQNMVNILNVLGIDVEYSENITIDKIQEEIDNDKVAVVTLKSRRKTDAYLDKDTDIQYGHSIIITDYIAIDDKVIYCIIDMDLYRENNIKKYIIEEDLLRIYQSRIGFFYNIADK